MKSKLKIWEQILIERIKIQLAQYDFNLYKAKIFRLKIDIGHADITVNLIKHGGRDFDFVGNVLIRVDAVEEMLDAISKDMSIMTIGSSYTMGGEFGNLANVGQRRWSILSEDDIGFAATSFVQSVENIGIPYAYKAAKLSDVLVVLSGNELENIIQAPSHLKRCASALVVAYLIKDYEKIHIVERGGREFLKTIADPDVRIYDLIAKRLAANRK